MSTPKFPSNFTISSFSRYSCTKHRHLRLTSRHIEKSTNATLSHRQKRVSRQSQTLDATHFRFGFAFIQFGTAAGRAAVTVTDGSRGRGGPGGLPSICGMVWCGAVRPLRVRGSATFAAARSVPGRLGRDVTAHGYGVTPAPSLVSTKGPDSEPGRHCVTSGSGPPGPRGRRLVRPHSLAG